MGPITLFDKSFLQSLSVNESVWFDNFFLANVCPVFYIETLADLEKAVREGRTPEQEVGIMANKFPEVGGKPGGYHQNSCINDLLGYPVPMTGQILVAGGRRVETGGKRGAVFERSPEAEAFSRWQQGDFLEVERRYARDWRYTLSTLNLSEVSKEIRLLGINPERCRTLQEAKDLATSVVSGRKKPFEVLRLALTFLNIPDQLYRQIFRRWRNAKSPPLVDFAPYATYVLEVEVFFQIAVASKLIASERPSNRVDIAYLFYLPFCMMFVSWDRLHRQCAPLFLRADQEFVWAPDLKSGLRQINEHYAKLPDNIKEEGIMSFALDPPDVGNNIVRQLWSRLLPLWQEPAELTEADQSPNKPDMMAVIQEMVEAESADLDDSDFRPDIDQAVFKNSIRKKKGDWYQVPKSF